MGSGRRLNVGMACWEFLPPLDASFAGSFREQSSGESPSGDDGSVSGNSPGI